MRATVSSLSLLLLFGPACEQAPSTPKRVRSQEQLDAERAAAEAAAAAERAAAEPKPVPEGPRIEISNQGSSCRRTLCVAGPGPLHQGANRHIGELCRRAPGVVRRCEGQGKRQSCSSAWSLEEWRTAFDAMLLSMDQDGDGKIGGDDPPCSINAVGWSLGAMVAAEELPEALADDPRLDADRAVIEHLVLVAPYAPARAEVQIPASVHKAWIYRHSETPSHDCSRDFADGPWPSLPPVCAASSQCWDYDYSLAPELAFLGREGSRGGKEIGHCSIAAIVATIANDNLQFGEQTWLEYAPRLSDGSPGGREHPKPPPPPQP